jgi:hypothetical protein
MDFFRCFVYADLWQYRFNASNTHENDKDERFPFVRSIAALLYLPVTQNDSFSFADEASMTAVELLTAFSGESAKQYEPFFRFSEETRIVAGDPRRRNPEYDYAVFRSGGSQERGQ